VVLKCSAQELRDHANFGSWWHDFSLVHINAPGSRSSVSLVSCEEGVDKVKGVSFAVSDFAFLSLSRHALYRAVTLSAIHTVFYRHLQVRWATCCTFIVNSLHFAFLRITLAQSYHSDASDHTTTSSKCYRPSLPLRCLQLQLYTRKHSHHAIP
jgi:hypothetical protein